MTQRNWIVWGPHGTANPAVVYTRYTRARAAARLMARRYGGEFFVAELVSMHQSQGEVVDVMRDEIGSIACLLPIPSNVA